MVQFMMAIEDGEKTRKEALGREYTHKRIYEIGLAQAEKEKAKADKRNTKAAA